MSDTPDDESRYRIPFKPNDTWQAAPGCKILVLETGAVRIDYPRDWHVIPAIDDNSIRIHDVPPPDDNCVIAVSYLRLPPLDWSRIELPSLELLLTKTCEKDWRKSLRWDPIRIERRIDLDIAWRPGRFVDSTVHREAFTRSCLARRNGIQAFLTCDFWASDVERFDPIWVQALGSLQVAEWLDDLRKGPTVA